MGNNPARLQQGPILKPSRRGSFAPSVQGPGRAAFSKLVTASVGERRRAPRPGAQPTQAAKKPPEAATMRSQLKQSGQFSGPTWIRTRDNPVMSRGL